MKKILVSEIFGPTVQGEGAVAGKPTIFVRTGGCDYRCSWCDSMHAVDPAQSLAWQKLDSQQILHRIVELSGALPISVTLSGGNPCIQPLGELCDALRQQGRDIIVETQGTIRPDWIDKATLVSVSPKPPSADVNHKQEQLTAFLAGLRRAVLKFVVANEADLAWAREVSALYPDIPVYLQPCNPTPDRSLSDLVVDYGRLVDLVIEHGWYRATVLPQLHVLLWGNERGR